MTPRVSIVVSFVLSLWGPLGYGGPPYPIAAEGRLLRPTCAPSALIGDQQKLQQLKRRQHQQKQPLPGAAVHLSLRNSSSNPFLTAPESRSADSGLTSLRDSQRWLCSALLLPVGFLWFLVFLLITFRCAKPPKSALGDAESRFSSKGSSIHSRTSSTNSGRDPRIRSSNSRAMEEAEASPPAASFALQHLLRRAGAPTAQQHLSDWAPIRFRVAGLPASLRARQSPGDGNCLFVSVAAALWVASFDSHVAFDSDELRDAAASLRALAVETLLDPSVEGFVMEGAEWVDREHLLYLVSQQYNCQPQEYCSRMRFPTTWGGGPEILALAHALRRPIAVYTHHTGGGSDLQGRHLAARQQFLLALLQPQHRQRREWEQQQQEGTLRLCKVFGWTEGCREEPLHLLFTNAHGLAGGGAEGEANHFAPLHPMPP